MIRFSNFSKSAAAVLMALVATVALALPSPKDIEAAVNAGHNAQAEAMLREVIQEKSQSAKAHYELGQVLARESEGDVIYDWGGGLIWAAVPPRPEYDLLWFIASHAPDLEGWERDIFLAVREESFYFYPVFACQIMNEGWASYWHARLLREADFLPSNLYVNAIKAHSDVVRPFAADNQLSLAVNPYHLGFSIWEDIIERYGVQKASEIRNDEDDFGFIRNYLTQELAEKIGDLKRLEEELRAEGEAAVLVHWSLAEDIRALKRVHDAVG